MGPAATLEMDAARAIAVTNEDNIFKEYKEWSGCKRMWGVLGSEYTDYRRGRREGMSSKREPSEALSMLTKKVNPIPGVVVGCWNYRI
jgi:hypothetical protein